MAAVLRERLCAAAARRWGLQAHEVSLVEAELLGPQGQRLPAHELLEPEHLEAPVTQPVHTRPPLSSPGDPARLAELPDALTRRAVFTGEPHFLHDLQLPGMVHGRVLHPPAPCDVPCDAPAPGQAAPALPALPNLPELPGQLAVWRDGALFGVLAERPSQAEAIVARLAAALRWQPAGPAPCPQALDPQAWGAAPGPAEVPLHVSAAEPAPAPRLVSRREPEHLAGSTPAAEPTSRRTLYSRYTRPWLAHASIGPACAVARWRGEGAQPAPVLEVWTHSQGIFPLRRDLALAFGLAPEDVVVHHRPGAGCYGHNGADDAAFDAAWLAQRVPGRPVRTLWSRDEELRQAPLGPAMAVELAAELDDAGRILHWRHTLWSPGHSSRPGRAEHPALLGHAQREGGTPLPPPIDMPMAVGGGAERNAIPGYTLPSWEVWAHRVSAPWRSSALRSLGAFANVFAAESFIDEIAQATGQDPLALREGLLGHDPRGLATLQAAARLAGWRRPEEALARAQGLGYARYKGTGAWCAVVAQVEVQATLVVRRLVVVADIGQVVDADGAAQQLEGGAIQATSWALKEAVRPDLQDPRLPAVGPGAVPMLTFDEVPEVDVVLLPSHAPPLGAGEASIGPTVAAIANALAAALGVRVRDLPLTPERIRAAIDAQA
jgi:CO/xanthine dehydrogenase Mo-binding subunit